MIVRDVLSALRRRWWVLVGCVVLGLAAAGVSALITSDTYSSSARLLVATPHIDAGAFLPPGNITPEQAAANYAALATGSKIPQQVIDQVGLTIPIPQLLQQTKVGVLANTTIIQITVTGHDPAQAQRIAQAFATDLAAYAPTVTAQSGSADTAPTITITDAANLPEVPVQGGGAASTLALGVIGGGVVGLALIWLLEYLDDRVRRPERLRDVAEAPVLGTIAAAPQDGCDAVLAAGREDTADGYRTVRTALQFVDVKGDSPTFAITGARAGSGTSAVAANIAASTAQAGLRTLLVDADLHSPGLAGLLGLAQGGPGLAELLAGTASVTDAVQPWADGHVDVIAAGAASRTATELVQSKAMDALLATLRGRYDVVILDTPALSTATDAALLASASDGAVVVARSGRTTEEDVRRGVERIEMVRGRVLGTVFLGGRVSGMQLPAVGAADVDAPYDQGTVPA